jgi:hypothetical protein
MRFVLLIHESQELLERRKDPAMKAAGADYGKQLRAADALVSAAGLHPPQQAKFVSVRDSNVQVIDGPYAETKEFIGGFAVIEAPDMDQALQWAAKHPAAPYSAVEVREILASY